jgi:hypothetical protein
MNSEFGQFPCLIINVPQVFAADWAMKPAIEEDEREILGILGGQIPLATINRFDGQWRHLCLWF